MGAAGDILDSGLIVQQDNATRLKKGTPPQVSLSRARHGGGRDAGGNLANWASRIFAAMDTAAITPYIELNPQVRFGKPVVKGTRTTVAEVLEMLANGMSAADIAEDFPAIGAAQVRACLLYAAYRESMVLQAAA